MVPQSEIDLVQYVQPAVQNLQGEPDLNNFAVITVCKLRKVVEFMLAFLKFTFQFSHVKII